MPADDAVAVMHEEDGAALFGLPGTITPTSWVPPESLDYDRWAAAVRFSYKLRGAALWWVGDGLNWGEARYGETYAQMMDATEYEYSTLANAASVARKVAPQIRRADLTWSHHAEVAVFPDAPEQAAWLARAAAERLTSKALREAVRIARGFPAPGTSAEPEGTEHADATVPRTPLGDAIELAVRQAWTEWTDEDGPKGLLRHLATRAAYQHGVRERLARRTVALVVASWPAQTP